MSGALGLVLAVLAGAALGAFYFGTLWLVVRRLDRVAWPALWLGGTALVRLAVVVGLAVLLVGPRGDRLLAALLGFVAVRVVLTRRLGRPGALAARRGLTRGGP